MKKFICREIFFYCIMLVALTVYVFTLKGYFKDLNEIVGIISLLILCFLFIIFIIPIPFTIFKDKNIVKDSWYIAVQLLFVLIPVGLLGEYVFLSDNKALLIFIIFGFLVIASIVIYKNLLNIDIIHIKRMKSNNTLLVIIFTILSALLGLCRENLNTFLIMMLVNPFLILQYVYEKLLLNKDIEEFNKKHDPTPEKEINRIGAI